MLHFVSGRKCTLALILLLAVPGYLYPCTVLFLPLSPDQVVAVAMDWPIGKGLIFINKRHVLKQSAFIYGGQAPLSWTSQYMSITFTQTGLEFP